ncbi:response regulator transcription factor [Candidatus Manganitrophus noduliformans]|uniref:Phosphate regulon transcriptional regulatory protein PhoB n=1 Tax=Candidatus Manganitrophus noduliformans TaxID=2606439 RepID=A0A7X6IA34_9BACT|nr:response regulator transcription factor [Candidatus Manganitrophus noduliformans]NKE70301.1 response regulator transcription factor [Candidatus Manganitrophus noduliformans]
MTHPVLIVEDDRKTAALLSLYLQREGFDTREAYDGEEALSIWMRHPLTFILLDVMVPRLDGIEVCRRVREKSDVPIMMVTAKVEEADRLVGLSTGADDYVTKPFSPREVIARVKAILRRAQPINAAASGPLSFKGLEIDTKKHSVTLNGVPIQLTHFEFKLLLTLITQPGHVYSRETLLEKIYPMGEAAVLDRTIDVHIRNLREKIERDPARPNYIKTVRGVGYKFAEE